MNQPATTLGHKLRRLAPHFIAVGCLTVAACGVALAAPTKRADSPVSLRNMVRATRHPDLRWPLFSDFRTPVERLYLGSNWQALWLEGSRPTEAANQLIARMAFADSLGLDPADYDAAWLARTANKLSGQHGAPTAADLARFDLGLSVAAVRFVSALSSGRVDPRLVHAQLDLPRSSLNLDAVVESLRNAEEQEAVLEGIQPQLRHYRLLKNALARYRQLANDKTLVPPPDLPRNLRPGMPLPAAARLRHLLEAMGDLPRGKRSKARADDVYSADLVEAVKTFQRRQGQLPDGILWPQTASELSRPFEERVRKIQLALERWRWMPSSFPAPPIIVNIPAFRLYAFRGLSDREDNMLAMDVLVGSADKNDTPVFAAEMTHLIFRPYWEVPSDIMANELGQRVVWDKENLEKLGFVLVSSDATNAPMLPLTAENVKRIGKGLRMRQLPGPNNSMGLVKFILPDTNGLYLHDTPVDGLFVLPRRDFSHGCIRVSDPTALAAHVLRDQPDWRSDRVRNAMNGEDNMRVNLTRPVPVYVVYATAAASESGEVFFYADIYDQDPKLDALLKKGYPYPRRDSSGKGRWSVKRSQAADRDGEVGS